MSGTISLVGPSTVRTAPKITATAVNTAVNAALATKADTTALATKVDGTSGTLTSPTVTGGTINATTIGATTPAEARVTTLQLTNLPTDPTGLPAGTVWNNGGALCVV